MLLIGARIARVIIPVALLLSCKAPIADDRPLDQVPEKTLEAEKQLVREGKEVGVALRLPRVVVDAGRVRVNGYDVAPRSSIDAVAVRDSQPLRKWLRGLREHWKAVHNQRTDIDELATVTVPGDMSLVEGASLLRTLAYAGYPDVEVHCDDVTVGLDYRVKGPPAPDDGDGPSTAEVCLWEGTGEGRWSAAIMDAYDYLDVPWKRSPWTAADCARAQPVSASDIASRLSAECHPCESVVIGGTKTLRSALVMLKAAQGAPLHSQRTRSHGPVVGFATAPCGSAWSW